MKFGVKIDIPNSRNEKFLAFAQLLIEESFVIKNLRLIQKRDGQRQLAMPSRRIEDKCPNCHKFNKLEAAFCNWCGSAIDPLRIAYHNSGEPMLNRDGNRQLYEDLAHPIVQDVRNEIEAEAIKVYGLTVEELRRTDLNPNR